MNTDSLVQPIVLLVDKTSPASNLDGIRAAAVASVIRFATHTSPDEAWDEWLDGPFTKSVRRADAKTFHKLAAAHTSPLGGHPTNAVSFGTAQALAFAPSTYADMPKALTRLQVSGTTLPDTEPVDGTAASGAPEIVLNAGLAMSTGKAAAQAAHALFAWFLDQADNGRDTWLLNGCPLTVGFEETDPFIARAATAVQASLIVDNGLTEIDPGSPTAFVTTAKIPAAA